MKNNHYFHEIANKQLKQQSKPVNKAVSGNFPSIIYQSLLLWKAGSFSHTMETLNQVSHNLTNSSLSLLLNYVVNIFFNEFHGTCIIKTKDEPLYQNVIIPSVIITMDQDFNTIFRLGVDTGCQAFIVYGKAIEPFLDSFLPVHDSADQRFSGKKLISVLNSDDLKTFELLFSHSSIKG